MKRPHGSNADEWTLFLLYWLNDLPSRLQDNVPFLAVQIAEAIDGQIRSKVGAPAITITITPATIECLQRLLAMQDPNSEANTHGTLDLETLAAMLMEDAAMVIRRPGSWEGSKMADLLESHGYASSPECRT